MACIYLAQSVHQIDIIYRPYYHGSIKEYIQANKLDAVILFYSDAQLQTIADEMYNFE